MKTILNPKKDEWQKWLQRPVKKTELLLPLIKEVFEQVDLKGDAALRNYTRLFDHQDIAEFTVNKSEWSKGAKCISSKLKTAIDTAAGNITRFHQTQLEKNQVVETTKGVFCWKENRGIEKVGIYIPGGEAPLFSTVLMLAIPAKLAGCKEIILCTPPGKDGQIHPAILYAAEITGVTRIQKIGGIQAIAALTFGTESIPAVYKITGPGNQYVTNAKQYAQMLGVAIDMPAGPSEVLVTADQTAVPAFVAADLISQAEHGADSQCIGLFSDQILLEQTYQEIRNQLENIPRKNTARQALDKSVLILLEDRNDRVDLINQYAPEHLIIAEKDPKELLMKVKNAGSVFLGNYSPESAGDYASGTNHTLPTNGFAKAYSGVSVQTFMKTISVQEVSSEGLLELGPTITTMATEEQLMGHKNAVDIRIKILRDGNN